MIYIYICIYIVVYYLYTHEVYVYLLHPPSGPARLREPEDRFRGEDSGRGHSILGKFFSSVPVLEK